MGLTRSQIREKINRLTREKNTYQKEKEKYNSSLNYAQKLVKKLENSKNHLNSSNDYMKKFFTIGNNTADNGKINDVKGAIDNILKKLTSSIIPSINSNIRTLTNKINNLDREINSLKREYERAEN